MDQMHHSGSDEMVKDRLVNPAERENWPVTTINPYVTGAGAGRLSASATIILPP